MKNTPWIVKREKLGRFVMDAKGYPVASVFPRPDATVNARLLAAAPEILAALKMPIVLYALGYVSEFAGDGGDHTEADGRKADAAIKAIEVALAKAKRSYDIHGEG